MFIFLQFLQENWASRRFQQKKNNSNFFASLCHHVTSFASDEKPISGISNENRLENNDYFEATWRKSAPTYTHKHRTGERCYFFISFKNLATSLTYSYTEKVFQTLSLQIAHNMKKYVKYCKEKKLKSLRYWNVLISLYPFRFSMLCNAKNSSKSTEEKEKWPEICLLCTQRN